MSDRKDHDLDLSAWDAEEPSADFAERVVLAAQREKAASTPTGATPTPDDTAGDVTRPSTAPREERSTRAPRSLPSASARSLGKRRATWAIASVAVGLAASAIFHFAQRAPSHGEITAETRTEVQIGDRAVAVLEPGATVKWDGDAVDQRAGNVFYRVERGGGFRVHTQQGDVDVQGTCFRVDVKASERNDDMTTRDWKVGGTGALVATLMLVSVYEGKVAVSHAQERATLVAGDSATVTNAGLVVSDETAKNGTTGGGNASSFEEANKNLVGSVSDYKKKLETIETQKKALEQKLAAAEEKLAIEKRGGDAAPTKNDFDLSQDDLVALAKEGTMKYRQPCTKPNYRPDAETLQKLGLAPQDGETIAAAYKRIGEWRETHIRPMCQEAVGKSELSEKMPVDACLHLVSDYLGETDPKARQEAQQLAVDIRAGLKPAPAAGEKTPVLTRMMLATTQQMKVFEDELAKTFGPEEAHRIAYADGLCMGHSTWGRGKK